jgi:hypothetical protein
VHYPGIFRVKMKKAVEIFHQRLLKFFSTIIKIRYRKNERVASFSHYLKKEKLNLRKCTEINELNICYNICSKIINEKLKQYSSSLLHGNQNELKEDCSCASLAFCVKQLLLLLLLLYLAPQPSLEALASSTKSG